MRQLVERYLERSARLAPVELRELRASRGGERARRQEQDMAALRATARAAEAVVVTERGAAWSSAELGAYLRGRLERAALPTAFLLGGEDGFRPEDEGWAAHRLGLTRLTLPHELARVVLAEQVYRALAALRNIAYQR